MTYLLRDIADSMGMVTIKNDGESGRKSPWLVAVCMNGKRTRRYFRTRVEAEQYANDTRTALKAGSDPESIMKAVQHCAGTGYAIDVLVQYALDSIRKAAATKLLYPDGDHQGMIHHHYVRVSRAEAERFFSLKPTDVLPKLHD